MAKIDGSRTAKGNWGGHRGIGVPVPAPQVCASLAFTVAQIVRDKKIGDILGLLD